MRYYHRVAASFCYYGLSYIARCIEIEMRTIAYKYFRPICLRESCILSWREFKVPVCPEMNHHISIKCSLHIEIRGQITVRRRNINTMHHLEVIVS